MAVENLQRVIGVEDTKAICEAFTAAPTEIVVARATDTGALGVYVNSAWHWFTTSATKASDLTTRYEPMTFADEVLIFNHDVVMIEVSNP